MLQIRNRVNLFVFTFPGLLHVKQKGSSLEAPKQDGWKEEQQKHLGWIVASRLPRPPGNPQWASVTVPQRFSEVQGSHLEAEGSRS